MVQKEETNGPLDGGDKLNESLVGMMIPQHSEERGKPPMFSLTDIGNGQRFEQIFSEKVKYIHKLDQWRVWDGACWSDDRLQLEQYAESVALWTLKEAQESLPTTIQQQLETMTEEQRVMAYAWLKKQRPDFTARLAHAKYTCSDRGIENMLNRTRIRPLIAVMPERFDQDPMLLNVKNGTIDLRTGELREHRQDDYITKVIDIEFDKDATHPILTKFLTEQLPDPDLRDYVQRAVGFTLTGNPAEEEKKFSIFGAAGAGKTTLLGMVRSILGPYATTAEMSLFTTRPNDDNPHRDLWNHVSSRLITAEEINKGEKFNIAFLNKACSGSQMKARRLGHDSFPFNPQFTIWIAANDRPEADGDSDAFWRRERVIEMNESRVGKEDPGIKRALGAMETAPGDPDVLRAALAWAVAGCLLWQARGLNVDVPAAVTTACSEYRASSGSFADFLAEHVTIETGAFIEARIFENLYSGYCENQGIDGLSTGDIKKQLAKRGITFTRLSGDGRPRGWVGMKTRTFVDMTPAEVEELVAMTVKGG